MRVFSRANGESAVAAAAYRAGERLEDARAGLTHHYQHRKGVARTFILAPADAPDTTHNRALLWNAAEAAETRKNARVAREVILALPHELSDEAREGLVRDLGLWMVERYRVAVDVALHRPVAGDGHDPRNHHAHILFTTREVGPHGLGPKTRILDDKELGPQEIERIRKVWEALLNDALRQAGHSDRQVDRRTLEAQGIDRIPQIHEGPDKRAQDMREGTLEEEEKKDDDEEKGSGESGTGSHGAPPAPPSGTNAAAPAQSSAAASTTAEHSASAIQKADTNKPTVERRRNPRTAMMQEIRALNTERAKWPAMPLPAQIMRVEQQIDRLHHAIHRYEQVQQRLAWPRVMARLVQRAVREIRQQLTLQSARRTLFTQEQAERAAPLPQRIKAFGRYKRARLQVQMRRMRTDLDILEGAHREYRLYAKFVRSIEQGLANQRPAMTGHQGTGKDAAKSNRPINVKLITASRAEQKLKLALKAALVREQIPKAFRPPETKAASVIQDRPMGIVWVKAIRPNAHGTASPIQQVIERGQKGLPVMTVMTYRAQKTNPDAEPLASQPKAESIKVTKGKLTASFKRQAQIQNPIEPDKQEIPPATMATARPSPKLSGAFNAKAKAESPKPILTPEATRIRLAEKASAVRATIPEAFRAKAAPEPMPKTTDTTAPPAPRASKLRGAFAKAAGPLTSVAEPLASMSGPSILRH